MNNDPVINIINKVKNELFAEKEKLRDQKIAELFLKRDIITLELIELFRQHPPESGLTHIPERIAELVKHTITRYIESSLIKNKNDD